MKINPLFFPACTAALLCAVSSLVADTATDLNVTGYISATGDLFIDGNTASFGTEGLDAGYIFNYVPSSDTVEFNASSSTASWIWRQGPTSGYVPQMQLSSANLLTLFRAGGTAGVVLNPASVSGATNEFIKLNSGGNTDGTAQRIAGYSDVRNGYLDFKRFAAAGPATGLVLGTNGGDVMTIRSGGPSDPGSVGIGTDSPAAKLEVVGSIKVSGAGSTLTTPSVTLPDGSTLTTARTNTLYNAAGQAVASVDASGRVNFANGLTIGSGATPATLTLNAANYLTQTLQNLGFREDLVAPTQVRAIKTTGSVTINALDRDGSAVYVAGFAGSGAASIAGASIGDYSWFRAFVAKLDATSGLPYWVQPVYTRGVNGSAVFNSVKVDGSGNVVVSGSFQGTTYGLDSPVGDLTSNGGSDALVIKYNSAGVIQWAQRVGGTNYDYFNSVAFDGGGNVIAAGAFQGTTTGLTNNLTSNSGSTDAFVVKYNSAGVAQWAQRVGEGYYDYFSSVASDGGGNIAAVGCFSNGGYGDALAVKYNSAGVEQWVRKVGGNGNNAFSKVATDASGNIVAVGRFSGVTTALTNNLTSNGTKDALVVKYNSAGVDQWARRVGGDGDGDEFSTVTVDGGGNLLVAGRFAGTATGLANSLTSSGSFGNGIIVKYSGSGVDQAAEKISGTNSTSITQLLVSDNSYWALGNSGTGGFTRVGDVNVAGSFAIAWTGLPIVTRAANAPASLAWGGSSAADTGVALGSSAFASSAGSAAMGSGVATASNAFAAGTSSATGSFATAFGEYNTASGYGSAAMGSRSVALGDFSLALGMESYASGFGSIAGGLFGHATGDYAMAMGDGSSASGTASFATGYASRASGGASFATGNYTSATGDFATAWGDSSLASGTATMAVGSYTTAQAASSFVSGRYNVIQGDPLNWIATDDLFVVGNGSSSEARSNAFSIKKNGDMMVAGTSNHAGKGWFSFGANIANSSWTNAALTTSSIEIVNSNTTVTNSSPTLSFNRHGSGGPQFRLDATGTNVLYLESANTNSARNPNPYGGGSNTYFNRFHVDGKLTTSGGIGIGMAGNPTEALDVVGNAKVSGTLTVGGSAVATGTTLASYQLASGSGAGLTNLNASALSSGTIATARLPAAVTQLGATIELGGSETTGNLAWSRVDKANSSLADIPSRNFADLQSKPTTAAGYGLTDVVTKSAGGAVTLPGVTTAQGDITVKNRAVIRVSAAGDIGMGAFTSGTNPEL